MTGARFLHFISMSEYTADEDHCERTVVFLCYVNGEQWRFGTARAKIMSPLYLILFDTYHGIPYTSDLIRLAWMGRSDYFHRLMQELCERCGMNISVKSSS